MRSFCFDRSVSLLQAKSYLRDILAPSDQLTENRQLNCLEVMIEDKRSDLVFQYLKRRYPKVEVLGGNHHSPSLSECKIEIVESDLRDEVINEHGLGKRTVVKKGEFNTTSKKRSTMRLMEERWGALRFDQDSIEIKCSKRAAFIEVEVRMNSPSGMVATSLQVQPGVEFDLGQTVQDLTQKSRDLSTETGFLEKKTSGLRTRRIQATIR